MRRVLALAAFTTTVLLATACSGDPAAAPPPATTAGSPSGTPSASARPTAAATVTLGDPTATIEACTSATAGAADVTQVFTEQIAAIEAAAAKGDQTAMVAAAGVIQARFVSLSTTLTTLSQKPVDSDVKAALANAAAGLREISSESYPGTTQDTQKRLSDLAAAVALACG
jgi:hypothetical protein